MTWFDDWQDPGFARHWDAHSTRSNPIRDDLVDILVSSIEKGFRDGDVILDIGMGSGQLEAEIFGRLPRARVVGVDNSKPMLDIAAERLAGFADRYSVVFQDLTELSSVRLPHDSYQYVITSQTLHELPHEAKQSVLKLGKSALAPGGLMLIADRSNLHATLLHDAYSAVWDIWMRRVPAEEQRDFQALLHGYLTKDDHPPTAGELLRWLEELGLYGEPVFVQLNRFLIAAQHAGADNARS
ncbi:MAG: class I SAM-dependent methyltransferase [Chloroflexota bacterium]